MQPPFQAFTGKFPSRAVRIFCGLVALAGLLLWCAHGVQCAYTRELFGPDEIENSEGSH